jgi:hypothetical protein
MNISDLVKSSLFLIVAAGLFGVIDAAGATESGDIQANLTAADRQAEQDARDALKMALTKLSHHAYRGAYDRLERAETALLNRESLHLGAALPIDKPLPITAVMQEIRDSRANLKVRDVKHAKQLTIQAVNDVARETRSVT